MIRRFIFFILILSSQSLAQKFVYRIAGRRPDRIFKEGFKAWGDNRKLLAHVAGQSIIDKTSAFISAAPTREGALAFINTLVDKASLGSSIMYIYKIRADEYSFSVKTSTRALVDGRIVYPGVAIEYPEVTGGDEIAILNEVPPSSIAKAYPVLFDKEEHEYVPTGKVEPNPNYFDAKTHVNLKPYSETIIDTRRLWRARDELKGSSHKVSLRLGLCPKSTLHGKGFIYACENPISSEIKLTGYSAYCTIYTLFPAGEGWACHIFDRDYNDANKKLVGCFNGGSSFTLAGPSQKGYTNNVVSYVVLSSFAREKLWASAYVRMGILGGTITISRGDSIVVLRTHGSAQVGTSSGDGYFSPSPYVSKKFYCGKMS